MLGASVQEVAHNMRVCYQCRLSKIISHSISRLVPSENCCRDFSLQLAHLFFTTCLTVLFAFPFQQQYIVIIHNPIIQFPPKWILSFFSPIPLEVSSTWTALFEYLNIWVTTWSSWTLIFLLLLSLSFVYLKGAQISLQCQLYSYLTERGCDRASPAECSWSDGGSDQLDKLQHNVLWERFRYYILRELALRLIWLHVTHQQNKQ